MSKEKPASEVNLMEETPLNGKKDFSNEEVILSVRHLKQYFRFGRGAFKYNKAVHDVSFDVRRGEVVGLVGESGCGKTTTGRSIIRLYKITSGSIYFKGQRISAGTRWNEKEIKWKTIRINEQIKEVRQARADALEGCEALPDASLSETKKRISAPFDEKIAALNAEKKRIVSEQRAEIRRAHYDNRNCNKAYSRNAVAECKAEYKPRLEEVKEKSFKEKIALHWEYLWALRRASKAKLTSKMQMIFQDPIASLDPRMTVREIIAEGLHFQGIHNRKVIDEKVGAALIRVGLQPEMADRYPHEFSGGQRQRIGIARALIMNPEFLVCDEPVSALDVSIQAQVINLLNDLKNEMNLSILFIAHDLSVVKYFCDRIAVMYFGNMVELADSDELFKHPLHPYTEALLSAIPKPDPLYEKNRVRKVYDPSKTHDYSVDKPSFREVLPGHFVLCNDAEEQAYQQKAKELDAKKEETK